MSKQIDTLHLFQPLEKKLVNMLRALSPEDWEKQTVARLWKVKDVASHLLDTSLRLIARQRDGWMPPPDRQIQSYNDLVGFLNDLNGSWVQATKRLSPRMLTDFIETASAEAGIQLAALDPNAKAMFPVSWAGESESYNWFDIAREYTERWHHQQQIRDAIGDDEILAPEFYQPFLETLLRAWPYVMRETEAAEGTTIKTIVTATGPMEWSLLRRNKKWEFVERADSPVATTTINGKVAWKLFTKSKRKEDIGTQYSIKGDQQLGEKILDMVSVMA